MWLKFEAYFQMEERLWFLDHKHEYGVYTGELTNYSRAFKIKIPNKFNRMIIYSCIEGSEERTLI